MERITCLSRAGGEESGQDRTMGISVLQEHGVPHGNPVGIMLER